MIVENWFEVKEPEQILSPSLLVYKDRIAFNIDLMIAIAGNTDRLVPHIKTHKMAEVIRMQLDAGICKFKCATLAEAELLAEAGATWVLIAYQLVGPNLIRLMELKKKYQHVHIASLVDSLSTAQNLNELCEEHPCSVFIDVNNGMDRSGHRVNPELKELYLSVADMPNLRLEGLHVYDGHIRDPHFDERKAHSDADFAPVEKLIEDLMETGLPEPMVIAGGSPTFTVHAQRSGVYCSPGTSLLWDWGYGDRFSDQSFQHAAVLATRIISKPTKDIITVDLGHKAVAAENPIERRFRFLNLADYEVLSQSEEHGVIQVSNWDNLKVGDLLYALPYHICPTVALHETVTVIENRTVLDNWEVKARKRQITI
jgi:D-serine deaminase-like pyridoxal phosphate-dependent protein